MAQMITALVATAALFTGVGAQAREAAAPVAMEADYLVVGGGTAGCALAARLCEGLPDAKVVLLERGTPRSEDQEHSVRALRLMLSSSLSDTDVTEIWLSEPNKGLNDRTLGVVAARTLGGTSAINGAQFSRPEAKVPASWGLTGLDEATADRLYDKVKAQTLAGPQPDDIRMTYIPEWLKAAVMAGSSIASDAKGEPVDAVWEANIMGDDQGRRYDSAYAYLRPAMGGVCSGNLQLVQDATVSRVLLEGSTAVGVEYLEGGDSEAPKVVRASKEVVLSAGVYGTPKILMLSGIGPEETLKEYDIPIHADLPVGQDAHARGIALVQGTYSGKPVPPEAQFDVIASAEAEAQFKAGEGGPLATAAGSCNGVYGPPLGMWRSGAMMAFIDQEPNENTAQGSCILNTDPRSRARVKLNSTDINDPPTVDTNILAQQEELDRVVACYKKERDFFSALDDLGFNTTELVPGLDTTLEVSAREQVANALHFVGSCGIGRVVDKELKVKGFSNLRVVDASVIPDMPENAGPAGTTYMLAEYMAETFIAERPGEKSVTGFGGSSDWASSAYGYGMYGEYGDEL